MVTVVLPYFNAEKTIEQAVQSIINQTYDKLEILLIDNNSTDLGPEICTKIAKSDNRIQLLNESRQGVVYAANQGISKAKGAYIARMDADDIAHPERIQIQREQFRSDPKLDISATQVAYMSQTSSSAFEHFVAWSNQILSHRDFLFNQFVELPFVNPTLMVSRTTYELVGLHRDGNFPEDYEWFLRAMYYDCKVAKVNRKLLDWVDHSHRLTRTDMRYHADAFFQIKTEYLAKYLLRQNINSVWIWGAGKLAIKRSKWLLDYGIAISGYIDIKAGKKVSGAKCVHYETLSRKDQPFILSYVTNRGRRDDIRSFLDQRGYSEGLNYIIAG
ncbi:hypothetical protein BFP72_07290 [Reichenbachiella sp. 5M10]|uniref:glycosyltransferase family 2 protein n=1 Tax=Reichenbachiella sp. 5M10 TaxID=1889772 RepID=UPI000C15F306|nr:glycosyltransferase family 2 protein [Reichenbachiella sp. 5M10]PIB35213.1 hypothetical protein BFP72_07290 [Reichenbachiella sp. 5M10]